MADFSTPHGTTSAFGCIYLVDGLAEGQVGFTHAFILGSERLKSELSWGCQQQVSQMASSSIIGLRTVTSYLGTQDSKRLCFKDLGRDVRLL